MSARGEGAGQPSTSAQGQPAAPAPQKRGRGRPRKQQQVSTRAGWGHQPTSAPSAGARRRVPPHPHPQRGSPVAAAAARCRPAVCVCGGAGCGVPVASARLSPGAGRWGATAGRRVEAGGGVGRSASSDFRYCAQPRVARWLPVIGSGRGRTIQGSPDAFLAALQLPRGKEVPRGRSALRGRVGGAEVPGAVGSVSRQPGLLAGPGLARRSRPLGALPKFSVAGDSRLPDKDLVGPPGPLRCSGKGAAGEPASAQDGISLFGQGRDGE